MPPRVSFLDSLCRIYIEATDCHLAHRMLNVEADALAFGATIAGVE
jgi:hypothetical protein